MARKSGLGREDDFNFNKSKPKPPPKLSDIRQGDRTSFLIRPDKSLYPQDPCDNIHINDTPDLRIFGKGGREFGDIVLYDPVQKLNYLSQGDRYERSLNLLPNKIEEKNGKTIYYFCSSNSPSGFWEVTVGSGGTFLRFTPQVLTIICPRPFKLQDLIAVETDGTSIKWMQTQGRLTIVSPSIGDGSLNPDIFIVGGRTPFDPPILLEAELEDNPDIFDILAIRTTLTEEFDGVSGMEVIAIDDGPLFVIPCLFAPLPGIPNTAYLWESGSIEITWSPPQYSKWVVEYRLQQNVGGVYQTVAVIPVSTERRVTIARGIYYHILTIFNTLDAGYSATKSCPIYLSIDSRYVFATDAIDGLSGNDGNLAVTQYPLSAVAHAPIFDRFDGLSGSEGNLKVAQYPLSAVAHAPIFDRFDGLSGSDGNLKSTIYNLSGGIVG
jgi:hypothetical protein